MLRRTWNKDTYLTGSCVDPATKKPKPFLVEDSSKVTLQRITELMKDSYAWASIAMVAHLSGESELIGRWSEGCGCPEHQFRESTPTAQLPAIQDKKSRTRTRHRLAPSGSAESCCFRGCRAPELATGRALNMQATIMRSSQAQVAEYISRAPEQKRSELHGSWSKARGQLWGTSALSIESVCSFL